MTKALNDVAAAARKTGAGFNRKESKQDYATPPDFMAAFVRRFGPVAFDLAASKENAKHERYFSVADNSLVQSWRAIDGNLWLNPPFDAITPWAKKCYEEGGLGGARVFLLVPASVGSNWFRDYVFNKAAVLFLNGRLHFDPAHPKWGYPKDCLLAGFGPFRSGCDVWTWK